MSPTHDTDCPACALSILCRYVASVAALFVSHYGTDDLATIRAHFDHKLAEAVGEGLALGSWAVDEVRK